MKQYDLNQGWKVIYGPLFWDEHYLIPAKKLMGEKYYECDLPSDVRMPLIDAGEMKDPVIGMNYTDSKWIEKRSWWYFKTFTMNALDDELYELFIERIDADGDVFVNGEWIGHHRSLHYPFIKNINKYLQLGENEIAVRVTTGLEKVNDSQMSELGWAICVDTDETQDPVHPRGDRRHSFIRRAQYNTGMDWDPRITTCGLTGNVFIRSYNHVAIRDVDIETVAIEPQAQLKMTVNVDLLTIFATQTADLTIRISDADIVCAETSLDNVLLQSGDNYLTTTINIDSPKLWWPNGYGEPHLYSVDIVAICNGEKEIYPTFRYGIRQISLDTSAIDENNRWMTLIVNGVRLFCKGGNWIPADALYARVSPTQYQTLIHTESC